MLWLWGSPPEQAKVSGLQFCDAPASLIKGLASIFYVFIALLKLSIKGKENDFRPITCLFYL